MTIPSVSGSRATSIASAHTGIVSFSKTNKSIQPHLSGRIANWKADYQALTGRVDNALSLNDLHAIANSLPRDNVTFEKICTQIGLKIARMLGTINVPGTANAIPTTDRATEIHRCLATFVQMEPVALRAAGLGCSIGMVDSVPPTDHQALFDDGLTKMKDTVTGSERGPVLRALIAVTTTSTYDGTGPASEQVAANIAQVLENMDGLSVAVKTQLVMTAMNQTKELCEPGWSKAMSAVQTAYQALNQR